MFVSADSPSTTPLQDFEAATETSVAYFGAAGRTHSRFCKRLHDDVDARMTATQDMPEHTRLQKMRKGIAVIMTLCKHVAAYGMDSDGLADAFDTQLQFLSMEPV